MKSIFTTVLLLIFALNISAQTPDIKKLAKKAAACRTANELKQVTMPAMQKQNADYLYPKSITSYMAYTSTKQRKQISYNAEKRITTIESLRSQEGADFLPEERLVNYYDGTGKLDRQSGFRFLDNMWVEGRKRKVTYDANGDMVLYVAEGLLEDGRWIVINRVNISYDNNHHVLMQAIEGRDLQDTSLHNTARVIMEYDNTGRMTKQEIEEWRQGAWKKTQGYERQYDNNGNMLMSFDYYFSDSGISGMKVLYTFDTQNRMKTIEVQSIMGGTVSSASKMTVTSYSAQNDILEMLSEVWENGSYVPSMKVVNTYAAAHKISTLVNYMWSMNQWMEVNQAIYTYDERMNEVQILNQLKNETGWVNESKTSGKYDTHNNRLSKTESRWQNDLWVPVAEYIYDYNAQNRLTAVTQLFTDGTGLKNNMKNVYDYDQAGNMNYLENLIWQNDHWAPTESSVPDSVYTRWDPEVLDQLEYYFYGWKLEIDYGFGTPSAVEDEALAVVSSYKLEQNYPNPFNPSTVITYELPEMADVELKVFDLLGREVATLVNARQTMGQHEVSFNASGLTSGIYIYRLKAGSQTISNKMILMK